MNSIKEINKIEKNLNKIEEKINLFFKLMKDGINSAKEAEKDEIPLVFIGEDMKEITLYDINKDKVYVVPLEKTLNMDLECYESYKLDIFNLLIKYIKTNIELLQKIDKMKGRI